MILVTPSVVSSVCNPVALSQRNKEINYLGNHKHRLAYQELRDKGLTIGSGGIESANKHICYVRLKISGAWWLVENSDFYALIALRYLQ
jgi:hypothetical protein